MVRILRIDEWDCDGAGLFDRRIVDGSVFLSGSVCGDSSYEKESMLVCHGVWIRLLYDWAVIFMEADRSTSASFLYGTCADGSRNLTLKPVPDVFSCTDDVSAVSLEKRKEL